MSGLGFFVKLMLALLLVAAAVTGTEIVDVVEMAEAATDRARAYVNDVDVDADDTALFEDRIDPETGEQQAVEVFARTADKGGRDALAYVESDAEPEGADNLTDG